MNRLLDIWPATLSCRYFDRSAAWTLVYICSNQSPTEWYKFEHPAVQNALFRRLTTVLHITARTDDLDYADPDPDILPQLDETLITPNRYNWYN